MAPGFFLRPGWRAGLYLIRGRSPPRGPRQQPGKVEHHGRGAFPRQYDHRTAACEAALGGWNQGISEALACRRQARFRVARTEGGGLRGWRFWHGCRCKYLPRTNTEFWRNKIETNRRRDRRVARSLRRDGWTVLRIKECAVRRPSALARIAERWGGLLRDEPLARGQVAFNRLRQRRHGRDAVFAHAGVVEG